MPQFKRIVDGEVFNVLCAPELISGIWECGDRRFFDPAGDQYEVLSAEADLVPLTPMTFYLAFTPAERILIKASTDERVKEFWSTYELAVQLNKNVDPRLVSVRQAIVYMAQKPDGTPPGPGILASTERIQQILSGIPQ